MEHLGFIVTVAIGVVVALMQWSLSRNVAELDRKDDAHARDIAELRAKCAAMDVQLADTVSRGSLGTLQQSIAEMSNKLTEIGTELRMHMQNDRRTP